MLCLECRWLVASVRGCSLFSGEHKYGHHGEPGHHQNKPRNSQGDGNKEVIKSVCICVQYIYVSVFNLNKSSLNCYFFY